MPGPRSPGFSPPHFVRLGNRPAAAPPVGGVPLPVLEIPYEWIAAPLARRPTTPVNSATISQASGITAYSVAASGFTANGASLSTTLTTAVDADASNLAAHFTTYYGTARPRQPTLTFNLFSRTDAECLTLLGAGLLRRIRIIHTPTGWPPGAANFTIQGIRHVMAVDQRVLVWSTAAIVGTTTTAPGPWFRRDSSSRDGTDLRPF